MDHRWDDEVRRARQREEEQRRLGVTVVPRDPDVERRDRLAREARRARPRSPWEIGAAHYDQRDLYTRNARIDNSGYGRGPSYHPEEGSYAYVRPIPADEERQRWEPEGPVSLRTRGLRRYQREAWPWLNYERRDDSTFAEEYARLGERRPRREGLLGTITGRLKALFGAPSQRPPERRRVRPRSRLAIYDEVNDRLAHDGRLDAHDIEVAVQGDEVTLYGMVPDRASKRLAEDLAMDCDGVREVHNRLRIRPEDDDTDLPMTMPLRAV